MSMLLMPVFLLAASLVMVVVTESLPMSNRIDARKQAEEAISQDNYQQNY